MTRRRTTNLLAAIAVGWLGAIAVASPAATPRADAPEIRVLEIDGVIGPLTARYLARELAEARDAEVVVIRLDTPGGLMSSMRAMSRDILGARRPVVVHVAPSGARAASAGMFLTIAGHVAAMAPGTNIGAAHPVGAGGKGDETITEKATADAAALARAIAEVRGRNAAWVERAVRESVSITAEEALRTGVIDVVASDLDELLAALDGRRVTTAAGEVTLETTGARIVEREMSWPERLLHALTDPNIAYLLLTLGMIGLAAELYSPGMFFPGILGAISLVLAFVSLGSLPLNVGGLVLILLAGVLLVAEVYVAGFGVLGIGGIAAFVLGSLLLYSPTPAMPDVRVDPWLVAVVGVGLAGFFLIVLRAVLRARRGPVATGIEALVGSTGVAASELSPEGTVELGHERWRAAAEEAPIHRGEPVLVTGVEGVTLRVTRKPRPPGGHPHRGGVT